MIPTSPAAAGKPGGPGRRGPTPPTRPARTEERMQPVTYVSPSGATMTVTTPAVAIRMRARGWLPANEVAVEPARSPESKKAEPAASPELGIPAHEY